MKVKKLEWVEMAFGNWWQDKLTRWFAISKHDDFVFKLLLNGHSICEFQTFEEAEKHCKGILEHIVNRSIDLDVKEFDPTLLGFKYQDSENGIHYYEYIENESIWLLEFPKTNKWSLFINEDEEILGDVKIPDHDFGVKLVSQFLEVE
jgi:hypothetical protein